MSAWRVSLWRFVEVYVLLNFLHSETEFWGKTRFLIVQNLVNCSLDNPRKDVIKYGIHGNQFFPKRLFVEPKSGKWGSSIHRALQKVQKFKNSFKLFNDEHSTLYARFPVERQRLYLMIL